MLMAHGDMSIFFSNWLVGSIMALGIVMLVWPVFTRLRAGNRATPVAAD